MGSRRASLKYVATMYKSQTGKFMMSDHNFKIIPKNFVDASLRSLSLINYDKRLLIVSKRKKFQSMSNLIVAAKEGNVAKVLEMLPTTDINGTDEVR